MKYFNYTQDRGVGGHLEAVFWYDTIIWRSVVAEAPVGAHTDGALGQAVRGARICHLHETAAVVNGTSHRSARCVDVLLTFAIHPFDRFLLVSGYGNARVLGRGAAPIGSPFLAPQQLRPST